MCALLATQHFWSLSIWPSGWPDLTMALLLASLVAAAIYLYLTAFGKFAQKHRGAESFVLPVSSAQTFFDKLIEPLTAASPTASGLFLLLNNIDSFGLRLETARNAGRSLDLQYYYWKGDLTGNILCLELIRAADRGVRVRLLLDDFNAPAFDATYVALDSHPNIDVRLFNPSRARTGSFQRGLELVLKYVTITRRMHNKSWMVDGRLAIVGGRNIGDAYFDAAQATNFRDADTLLIGDAVCQAEKIFDEFWNSHSAIPIRMLHRLRKPNLSRLQGRLERKIKADKTQHYLREISNCRSCIDIFSRYKNFNWQQEVQVLSDPPEKAAGGMEEQWIGKNVWRLLEMAQSGVEIVSPYFIPGKQGTRLIQQLAARGVQVRILTNSLAATDVAVVHGVYARYRKSLLSSGIKLYELKSRLRHRRTLLFGSSSASLHTKSIVVDSRRCFIGSFNLDPRSESINTEMGVFFEDENIAKEMQAVFERQTSLMSFNVLLENGQLRWDDATGTSTEILKSEPDSTLWRRIIAGISRFLPIESQL